MEKIAIIIQERINVVRKLVAKRAVNPLNVVVKNAETIAEIKIADVNLIPVMIMEEIDGTNTGRIIRTIDVVITMAVMIPMNVTVNKLNKVAWFPKKPCHLSCNIIET